MLALGSAAIAATPKPRAHFLVHDHRTPGDGWHIEMRFPPDARHLSQLVLFSERCDETVLTTHVGIRDDGSIASTKPYEASDGQTGSWRLDARWSDRDHVSGTFQVTTLTDRKLSRPHGGHAEGALASPPAVAVIEA